jgi:hypothetical protein
LSSHASKILIRLGSLDYMPSDTEGPDATSKKKPENQETSKPMIKVTAKKNLEINEQRLLDMVLGGNDQEEIEKQAALVKELREKAILRKKTLGFTENDSLPGREVEMAVPASAPRQLPLDLRTKKVIDLEDWRQHATIHSTFQKDKGRVVDPADRHRRKINTTNKSTINQRKMPQPRSLAARIKMPTRPSPPRDSRGLNYLSRDNLRNLEASTRPTDLSTLNLNRLQSTITIDDEDEVDFDFN